MTIASITIIGAGAMGCYFAARLCEAGYSVTLIDVDLPRLHKIAAEGIIVNDAFGERRVQVRAVTAAEARAPVDLVMLFTKGMHSIAAMDSVAHLATAGTLAVTIQNGLGNAEAITRHFPKRDTIIGMTDVPADLEGPNVVSSKGKTETALGPYEPGEQLAAEAVAEVLRKAGFRVEVTERVQDRIWEKLAFNAAINAVATITRRRDGGNGALDSDPGRRLLIAAADEVATVADALGINVDRTHLHAKIINALQDHRDHKPSMLQDFLAGRKTEIESINGAVVRAAEAAGIPAPINATLAELVRMIEEP